MIITQRQVTKARKKVWNKIKRRRRWKWLRWLIPVMFPVIVTGQSVDTSQRLIIINGLLYKGWIGKIDRSTAVSLYGKQGESGAIIVELQNYIPPRKAKRLFRRSRKGKKVTLVE